MLGCLGRWVRATFDYNPIFPISALLLLSGVQQLVHEGAIDAGSAGGAVCGVSIVQAYELALLAVALLVLWPRKIAYETTAILIIFGVVRFAPLFLAIGLAVEGQPREAAFLGGGLALLMALQNEAISRKILPGERWELWYDGALYTVAAVGLPLLAHELARGTGASFSHDAARLIQLGAWWGCAVLLAPLALWLPQLGEDAPLFVPGPTATLRSWLARRTGLCLLGLPALLGNALWLGGAAPVPLFLLPLALVAVGVARAVAKAAGAADRPGLAHVPAVLAVGVLLLPLDLLVGRTDFIGRPAALALFLPFAGAALPLLAPGRARSGLRSLALVAGAAPLVLAPSLVAGERYLIVLSVLLVLVGLAKKNERLLAHGAIAALALSAHLTWDGDLGAASRLVLGGGAGFALLVALRLPASAMAARVALVLCAAPALLETARGVPPTSTVAVALGAAAAVGFLARRRHEPLAVKGAAGLALVVLARRLAPIVDPGVALVVLSFASLVAGTAVALGRERRASEARAREAAAAP